MAPKKNKLSKHVLEMKFMKRTKESEDLKRFEDEGKAFFQDAIKANLDSDGKECNIVVHHNWYFAENLSLGRYSFNGMNPKIEEIMKSYCKFDSDSKVKQEDENEVDVSAQQFARNIKRNKLKKKNVQDYLEYQNDVRNNDSTVSKGNKRKNEATEGDNNAKKTKFLKPDPDD